MCVDPLRAGPGTGATGFARHGVVLPEPAGPAARSRLPHPLKRNLHDELKLDLLNAPTDVFVVPSREDKHPTPASKALPCGPVVAFASIVLSTS